MKWAKQGLVYAPDGRLPWAKKHAFPPTPIRLHDGEIRIYLSFTDDDSAPSWAPGTS